MLSFRDITAGTRHNLGSSGTSDEKIHKIIHEVVAATIREAIPEMFRSIKTMLIEIFDERYIVVTEATAAAATVALAAARPQVGDSMLFRQFSNTKPPEFEGCFYRCSCLDHLRVRFALNQLQL